MAPRLTVAEPVPFVRAKLKQICPKLSDSLGDENRHTGFRPCRTTHSCTMSRRRNAHQRAESSGEAIMNYRQSRAQIISKREALAKEASPFLTTAFAALYLQVSERTLQYWRWHGSGPRVRRHGRSVLYHIDDLEIWSQASARKTPVRKPAQ